MCFVPIQHCSRDVYHNTNPWQFHLKPLYGVRSFSFPGSTPVCGVFFFQDERVQIITHVRPGKKTATHRGRPREAKRTHPMTFGTDKDRKLLVLLLISGVSQKEMVKDFSEICIHEMLSHFEITLNTIYNSTIARIRICL